MKPAKKKVIKKKKVKLLKEKVEVDEKTYFKFQQQIEGENAKQKNNQDYAIQYEDLEYLQETLTFKNPKNNFVLPSEQEIVDNEEKLKEFLETILNQGDQETVEQFLKDQSLINDQLTFKAQEAMTIHQKQKDEDNRKYQAQKTVINKQFDQGSRNLKTMKLNAQVEKLDIDELFKDQKKLFNLLRQYGYSDIEELGHGAFGYVVKAQNQKGYKRAIKIQKCDESGDQVEFKLGRLLFYEGIENLYGNSVMTYNMHVYQDSISGKKLAMIEMELAESTLAEFIESRMDDEKQRLQSEITDDEFQEICIQLIGNVLCMHNLCLVHRDIKKQNILVVDNQFVLADFGVSEEIQNLAEGHIKGTDEFQILTDIGGSPLYMPPIFKFALKKNVYAVKHDPFKSDLYSLGLNLLEIQLLRSNYSYNEILGILTNPEQAYQMALKTDINQYINKGSKFLEGTTLKKLKNILAWMLEIDEKARISSIRLALICQLDQLILSKLKMPYKNIFVPTVKQIKNNIYRIDYTLKDYHYEGQILNNKEKIRDGYGIFHGDGKIMYKDQIIIQQYFQNYLIREFFDEKREKQITFNYDKPQKTKILYRSKIIELLDLADQRIIEMDYQLVQNIGNNISQFLRSGSKTTLRLYWKSKEKYKQLFLKGDNQAIVEIYYDEEPEIQKREFEYLNWFVGCINFADLTFIKFQPSQYFKDLKFNWTQRLQGFPVKFIGEDDLKSYILKDHLKYLTYLDLSNSNLFCPAVINALNELSTYMNITKLKINNCLTTQSSFQSNIKLLVESHFFDKIQSLSLNDNPLDDEGFHYLLKKGKKLVSLQMEKASQLTVKSVQYVRQYSKELQKLKKINFNNLFNFFQDDRRNANYKQEVNGLLLFLNNLSFTNLKKLSLDNTKVDAYVIKDIMNFWQLNNLEYLSAKNCKQLTTLGLYYLHNGNRLQKLKHVFVDGSRIEIKVEMKRLFKNQMNKAFEEISFLGCTLITAEQILRYLSLDLVMQQTKVIHLEQIAFNDQVCQHIKQNTNITKIVLNVETTIQLSSIIPLIRYMCTDTNKILIELTSKTFTDSSLKHLFIQELHLNSLENMNFNLIIGEYTYLQLINEIGASIFHEEIKMLNLPIAEIALDEGHNIFEDLKKLSNSKKFLEIKNLDLSKYSVSGDTVHLLTDSQYVSNLITLDLSNSSISNSDLVLIGTNPNNTLKNLKELIINNCKSCNTSGINQIKNLPKLQTVYAMGIKLLVDSISGIKFNLVLDQIQIIGDNEENFLTNQWISIVKPNLQNLTSVTIIYAAPNILKRFNKVIHSNQSTIQELKLDLAQADWKKMGDTEIAAITEGIQSLNKLKKMDINMKNWAYKNNKITNFSIKEFYKILSNSSLEQVNLNFERWATWHASLTDDSFKELSKKIKFQNLVQLKLNFDSWGNGNQKITDQSLKEIGNFLKEAFILRVFDLNISKWTDNNLAVGESGYQYLSQGISQLKSLEILILNVSMEQQNLTKSQRLGDQTVKYISQSISALSFLKKLDLNFSNWGCHNPYITDNALKEFSGMIYKLKNLKYVRLNLDNWNKKNSRITNNSIKELSILLQHIKDPYYVSIELADWEINNPKISTKEIIKLTNYQDQEYNTFNGTQLKFDKLGGTLFETIYQNGTF
ncbi:Protein kinase-like domain [Pseudocohnilembus persalinus]|uniref:Protein kinase-like domain n=1 Tax=Pseudocohnilembus persalinus TaxID=266149 RepID=A0A0V0QPA4_PSEPJ|nr:Protein kinase-like domain [Pseudocohnilembus persalinus]|eukprot:KRX03997.1 Protein kinase-like domain [Pseudocohnilembus persalinus]